MSKDKLLKSLVVLAGVLEINPPVLDDNNSLILRLDGRRMVYFNYDEKLDQLMIYMPIIEQMPHHPGKQQLLFKSLLDNKLTRSRAELGTIAYDREKNMILFYHRVDMGEVDEIYLPMFIPTFVEMAIKWCSIADTVMQKVEVEVKRKVSTLLAVEDELLE